MKDTFFTIAMTRHLAPGVFELKLDGDTSGIQRPGQFVEIAVPGKFLRRPISIADWGAGTLTILVRTVGAGTAWLESAAPGTRLDVILPLGNGFDASAAPPGSRIVLAGGGIGVAPLYALAKSLAAGGREFSIALGFRNAGDIFFADEFRATGGHTAIATEDGSAGIRGFVTDAIGAIGAGGASGAQPAYIFACGPMPMLKALAALPGIADGQLSLEARMGCGFGACMGCTIQTRSGPARVCREGPVFAISDLSL
ncbi:MAG: dihydroorotate dehydrogenase electron transfer subunit [Kiritimatiellae bacterium]|nr:dihydroorotate dehydrogenase electron transfer subunit [Kiritimatiellia bacterium]